MTYSLDDLNQMTQAEFTAALGDVFENTPAIARQTWFRRPFESVETLHQAMVEEMRSHSPEDQLALIRAHPDLGSRAQMAESSVQEQASVGLDQLTPDEYQHIQRLNRDYTEKFGFPFIIAVKRHTKASIFEAFHQRLLHSRDAEMQRALAEISDIAYIRLRNLVVVF